jgi:hypothetical protein
MSNTDHPRLPQSPDLEQERKRAKELLRSLRAGDGVAVARLRSNHPRFAHVTPGALAATEIKLSDAQWVIAREYGFPSWPALRAHIGAVVERSAAPPLNEESETAVGGIFACKYERHLKSVGRSFSTSITFRNQSPHNVSTFWLDYNGERVANRTLPSSYSYVQATCISHPWVVVDAAGRCMGIVLPGSSTRTVTISRGSLSVDQPGSDTEEKLAPLHCSFCGKSQHEVAKLVAGPNVFICDECVGICETVIEMPVEDNAVPERRDAADPMPTGLLLSRLKVQTEIFDRVRTDLGTTVSKLRERDVSWAAMGEALGISPQSAQERLSQSSSHASDDHRDSRT